MKWASSTLEAVLATRVCGDGEATQVSSDIYLYILGIKLAKNFVEVLIAGKPTQVRNAFAKGGKHEEFSPPGIHLYKLEYVPPSISCLFTRTHVDLATHMIPLQMVSSTWSSGNFHLYR